LPDPASLDLDGVALSDEAREKLFGFEREGWRSEFDGIGAYLGEFGERMPQALHAEQQRIAADLRD
jgi:phosphoenolpyruvate carboxykinase (GTP)